jgi:hypothetical protein
VDDATFIFHCGDRERIGIRHRESQTLYLSGLIDMTACKDPTYGEIQVGLHLTIIQDALQLQTQRSSECPSSSSKKRLAEGGQTSMPEPIRKKTVDVEHTSGQESGPSEIQQVNLTSI